MVVFILALLLLLFFLEFLSLLPFSLLDPVHELPHVVGDKQVPIVPVLHVHIPKKVEVILQPSLLEIIANVFVHLVGLTELLNHCGCFSLLLLKLSSRYFVQQPVSESILNFQGGSIVHSTLIFLVLLKEMSLVPPLDL